MNRDWWLKYQRAEKHMVDIQEEARRYASSNPYGFTRIRLPDSQNEIQCRFRITEQPDPMIAVMLGDFIHNLRSVRDYVVVASDNPSLRKYFEAATEGLYPNARAIIIELQPYRFKGLVNSISLGEISRLENADKHRQLITIGCGGKDCTLSFTVRGFDEPFEYHRVLDAGGQFLKDDTVIPFILPPDFSKIRHPDGAFIKPSDMKMHLSTTAKILLKIPVVGGNEPPTDSLIDNFMSVALYEVRGILKKLEFFAINK